MRDCPTVEGSSIPLIIHRIGAGDCLSRQACNYHKCHRCIFRGKAADWQPDGGSVAAGIVRPAAAAGRGSRSAPTVEVPRPHQGVGKGRSRKGRNRKSPNGKGPAGKGTDEKGPGKNSSGRANRAPSPA